MLNAVNSGLKDRPAVPDMREALVRVSRTRIPLCAPGFVPVLLWSQKSACTSVVRWFFFQTGLLDTASRYDPFVHRYENEVFKRRKGYMNEVRAALGDPERPKMKFVRDPYRRAVSSFLMLSAPVLNQNPEHFCHGQWRLIRAALYGDPSAARGLSFRQYLEWLEAAGTEPGQANPHFAAQYIPGEEKYVGRYLRIENLAAELLALEQEFGLRPAPLRRIIERGGPRTEYAAPGQMPAADLEMNEKSCLSLPAPHPADFYDDDTRARVARLFAADFEAYGYFPGPRVF